jgi:hypothetical protein
MLVTSCAIPLPVPSESESHPSYIKDAAETLRPGMMRSDVLMALGNPDFAARGHTYIGYRWLDTSHSTWLLGIPGIAAGTASIPGRPQERAVMFAFDAKGRIVRMRAFEAEYESTLFADVKTWMQGDR